MSPNFRKNIKKALRYYIYIIIFAFEYDDYEFNLIYTDIMQ